MKKAFSEMEESTKPKTKSDENNGAKGLSLFAE